MVWKLGKLQSAYNELRFDVDTVLAVHKSFVFYLLIFKQHGWAIKQSGVQDQVSKCVSEIYVYNVVLLVYLV